jgi:ABC-type nitrate/sulfonate/bicarbonate transport system substrate-binding protein
MTGYRRALAAGLALALGAATLTAARAETVRVGKSDALGFSFAILDVGIAKGFYKKAGLDIELSVLPGARNQQALAAGSIDIALGAGPDIALIAKGAPAKAVAAIGGPPLNIGLAVRPDSAITPAELRGKLVGVTSVASLTGWLAREFSQSQGWGPEGVKIVALGSGEGSIGALLGKNVDAIVVSAAQGLRLEEAGRAKVLLLFGDFIKDFMTHAIYASNDFQAQHPDALRRFLKAWFETVRWMRDNRAEAIEVSRKTTLFSPEMAGKTYDREMPEYLIDSHINEKIVADMLKTAVALGLLKTMPDPKTLYTNQFLE